ncbi:DUF4111 domain-containing protein [Streptomyces sp. IF17]|nr:DUF4111 domain-containing protein [Streptomyces alkaliphilus]
MVVGGGVPARSEWPRRDFLYGEWLREELVAGRTPGDVDLLLLTHRSLTAPERADLVRLLLGISGWRGHARRFPDAVHRRPVELTGIVVGGGVPARSEWPRRDFLYGEWLREELVAGRTPGPADDPDLVILLATAHAAHRVLHGPPLDDLLAGIEGDERNVLLTLARILVTLETGRIVPKDVAAEAVIPTLRGSERELLERARAGYLGIATDRWADLAPGAAPLARALADRADRLSRSDQPPETGP